MYRSNNILEEFKGAFNKPNNSHVQLIIINVILFVAIEMLMVLADLFGFRPFYEMLYEQFTIPSTVGEFMTRPWTIITYMFNHAGIMHLLLNMLWFYFFGRLIVEHLSNEKLISIYIIGGIAGAIAYLFIYNAVPFYMDKSSGTLGMVGASAAINAIVIAAATLLPNYAVHLIFIGPVRIKYIAIFTIVISLLNTTGGNAGGNIAHLGGAAIGYLYIKSLNNGTDIGRWVIVVIHFLKNFFVSAPAMKVDYSSKKKKTTPFKASKSVGKMTNIDQEEIDVILDKISQSGYSSLSKEEKQKLFNASKK